MLGEVIEKNEKNFNVDALQDILKMKKVILDHYDHPINAKELKANPELIKLYENFQMMLNECESILDHVKIVEKSRIIKRFKILRSMLFKFLNKIAPAKLEKSIKIDDELKSTKSTNTQSREKTQRLVRTRSDDSFDIDLLRRELSYMKAQKKRQKRGIPTETSSCDTDRILYRPYTRMLYSIFHLVKII